MTRSGEIPQLSTVAVDEAIDYYAARLVELAQSSQAAATVANAEKLVEGNLSENDLSSFAGHIALESQLRKVDKINRLLGVLETAKPRVAKQELIDRAVDKIRDREMSADELIAFITSQDLKDRAGLSAKIDEYKRQIKDQKEEAKIMRAVWTHGQGSDEGQTGVRSTFEAQGRWARLEARITKTQDILTIMEILLNAALDVEEKREAERSLAGKETTKLITAAEAIDTSGV